MCSYLLAVRDLAHRRGYGRPPLLVRASPAQVQIWAWVPEPPKPVSSQALAGVGVDVFTVGLVLPGLRPGAVAGVELHLGCRLAVPAAETSRHCAERLQLVAGGQGPGLRAGAVAGCRPATGGGVGRAAGSAYVQAQDPGNRSPGPEPGGAAGGGGVGDRPWIALKIRE